MKRGSKQTEEVKEKISQSLKGRFLGRHTSTEFKKGHKYLGEKKEIIKHGYRYIFVNGKYVREHREIWMQANNVKEIPEGFVIHHKNGIKTDNRIENLQLMTKRWHDKILKRRK